MACRRAVSLVRFIAITAAERVGGESGLLGMLASAPVGHERQSIKYLLIGLVTVNCELTDVQLIAFPVWGKWPVDGAGRASGIVVANLKARDFT